MRKKETPKKTTNTFYSRVSDDLSQPDVHGGVNTSKHDTERGDAQHVPVLAFHLSAAEVRTPPPPWPARMLLKPVAITGTGGRARFTPAATEDDAVLLVPFPVHGCKYESNKNQQHVVRNNEDSSADQTSVIRPCLLPTCTGTGT